MSVHPPFRSQARQAAVEQRDGNLDQARRHPENELLESTNLIGIKRVRIMNLVILRSARFTLKYHQYSMYVISQRCLPLPPLVTMGMVRAIHAIVPI